ncbi:MAG: DUF4132 domain-containing protein [Clostridia bacterium]|nr:DUF4132 domain-containing protein [Clostridia bacterium]
MNLLQTNGNTDTKTKDLILDILKSFTTDPDILQKAERFFDFSQELDLELLNFPPIRTQNFSFHEYNKAKFVEKSVIVNNFYKYSDRYILFMDALGAKVIYNLLGGYELSNKLTKETPLKQHMFHAFERRYGSERAQAKILSYIAGNGSRYAIRFEDSILKTAKNNPRLLFETAKFCIGSGFDSDGAKLFSLVLAYTDPAGGGTFTKEEISYMTNFILKDAMSVSLTTRDHLEFEMPILFLSQKHSDKIKKFLVQKLDREMQRFISAVAESVPKDCFEENIPTIFELISEAGISVEEVVKATVCAGYESGLFVSMENADKLTSFQNEIARENLHTANTFVLFQYEIINYPDDYIKAMFSTDNMFNVKGWGSGPKYYTCFFEDLYRLLEEYNPQTIKDHNIDHDKDMIDLYIAVEQKCTLAAKEEIGSYLRGEADFSLILDNYDTISDSKYYHGYGNDHADRVIASLKNLPEFKGRYLALKTIQSNYTVVCYARSCFTGSGEHIEDFKSLAKLIAEAGVPLKDRFAVYSGLYDYYWEPGQGQNIEKTILEMMVSLEKEDDEEYDALALVKDSPLLRNLYTQYLGATNDESNQKKDRILKMCGDSSKAVRTSAANALAKNKENEKDVLELLSAKKQAIRETAVDVLAIWGADQYSDILEKAAEKEKSVKLADKIRDVIANAATSREGGAEGEQEFSSSRFVENIHKGGRNKKILWLYETPNPEVHFVNGDVADEKYMQAIILCYAGMTIPGRNENTELLAKELNTEELNRYAAEIFSKWYSAGAESKTKWALFFSVIHGGSDMLDTILKCIKEWAENMRGAIAAEAVKAMALNGSSQALMAVDNLAHKFKQKQVKKAAIAAIGTAAEALGITADELGDRIVPTLGFNENMEQIFDYGTRKFSVFITPTLELEIYDESGKKLKNIPSPGKKDDEETAKKSNSEFKAMKKQLKNVISIQKMRLETVLLADRRWEKENWEALFVKNPIMHSFAMGLIWAAYEDDDLVQTFRYLEDGTFNTADEEEYELPENAKIGLVHPIELDEELLFAWKEQLSDYEIIQPIEQLNRKINRVNEDEIGTYDLRRFEGRMVNGMSLIGRTTKLGWYKGSPQDAGCFFTFYREDITERIKNENGSITVVGNAVELNFEGMYIGGDDSELEIKNVRFYHPGTVEYGSYVYDEVTDEKAIKLDEVDKRYFSEIINQLEVITKTAES